MELDNKSTKETPHDVNSSKLPNTFYSTNVMNQNLKLGGEQMHKNEGHNIKRKYKMKERMKSQVLHKRSMTLEG